MIAGRESATARPTERKRGGVLIEVFTRTSDMDGLPPRDRCLEPADAGRGARGQLLLTDA